MCGTAEIGINHRKQNIRRRSKRNEKQKREMLTKAVSALLAASLVPTVSAAEIANALAPVAIVQEAEVQQTEQALNLAVYAQASLQAQSGLTLRSRKPKIGMKRMWTIAAYKTKDKQTVYIAKKAKL